HRIQRRKKRRRTQTSPPDAVHAIADLATEIESGPARRHVGRRGTLHVGHIGCCSKFNRRKAHARKDGERSTSPEKQMASPGPPPTRNFRKRAGNVGESTASVRLLPDKVNEVCGSSLGRRAYSKSSASSVRTGRSGDAADRRYQRRGHSVVRAPCVT